MTLKLNVTNIEARALCVLVLFGSSSFRTMLQNPSHRTLQGLPQTLQLHARGLVIKLANILAILFVIFFQGFDGGFRKGFQVSLHSSERTALFNWKQ